MEESGLIGQERGPSRQFELGLWIFCGDIFVSGTSIGSRGGVQIPTSKTVERFLDIQGEC